MKRAYWKRGKENVNEAVRFRKITHVTVHVFYITRESYCNDLLDIL